MKKHYVTFITAGMAFDGLHLQPIEAHDPVKALELAKEVSPKPFAFTFSTVEQSESGAQEIVFESGIYYVGGTMRTLEDVIERDDPFEDGLRSRMRNGLPEESVVVVVEVREAACAVRRFTRTFNANDVVVDADTGVITHRGDTEHLMRYRKQREDEWRCGFEWRRRA